MVVINSTNISEGKLFTVVSGYTGVESYRWYVNDILRSINSFFILRDPTPGDKVYVILDANNNANWYDGHFYGGTFNGNFYGGTFHYGILNGEQYNQIIKKPKKFIQKK